MPSRDSERWTLGSVVFSARAASVVERVLSISLSIVPLDREVGRCRSIARSIRRLLPRFEDGPASATLASLRHKRSGATHVTSQGSRLNGPLLKFWSSRVDAD